MAQLCRTCHDIVACHFPGLGPTEISDFLWGATGYPAVGCANVVAHVQELAEKSGGDAKKAFAISNQELDNDMEWWCKGGAERGGEFLRCMAI